MTKLYVKKPEHVEAFQWGGDTDALPEWVRFIVVDRITSRLCLDINSRKVWIEVGDYLIKGCKGETHAMERKLFESLYIEAGQAGSAACDLQST